MLELALPFPRPVWGFSVSRGLGRSTLSFSCVPDDWGGGFGFVFFRDAVSPDAGGASLSDQGFLHLPTSTGKTLGARGGCWFMKWAPPGLGGWPVLLQPPRGGGLPPILGSGGCFLW